MCGIVGYIGNKQAQQVLLNGLKRLEYRGYDSGGISVLNSDGIQTEKHQGRLCVLEDHLKKKSLEGFIGIGHTRWATHGAPSDRNSHPHMSMDKKISVVHNGIIENYLSLKEELQAKGIVFQSETDTEVVAHLIREKYRGDLLDAVQQAVKCLRGAYALAVICADEKDKIVCVRKDSPLVIGIGKEENFIASDISAILEYVRDVYLIDDNTFGVLEKDKITLYDEDRNIIQKDVFHVTWNADSANKGGYEHFMLKEIYEQPKAIVDTLRGRICEDCDEIKLDDFTLNEEEFRNIHKIYIVACGTAYYAGCVGKNLIEKYARTAVETDIASEFRYKDPIIDEHTLFIAISQSGETADTLASLRLAKKRGARILAITNVVGSSVAREAQDVLYTWAGPEIAVASTKAYSTQVLCMFLTALKLGRLSGNLSKEVFLSLRDALLGIYRGAEHSLSLHEQIRQTAKEFIHVDNVYFVGRGIDYSIAREGSLKMKEISYIHAEAYQAGELKHGPIALIEDGMIVVALCTQKGELLEKTISNIKEVKARGAKVIAITQNTCEEVKKTADITLCIDDVPNDVTVIPSVVILQMLAYYASVLRGCDVDKPRNLAKSVTVE